MSQEVMPGAGRMLAEAREAKGLSVAAVAEKLKLTTRQVEALENEDFQRLPAAVFVRGFIRNYARLVDLPADSLLGAGEVAAEPTERITAHSEELRFNASPVRRWLLLPMAVVALFMLLVAGLYAWLSQGEEAYVPEHVAPAEVVPPPAQPVVPEAPAAEAPAPASPAVETPGAAVPPAPSEPGAAVVPAVPALPGANPAAAQATPPAVAPARPSHVVQLAAEQVDSWIEVVSADDKRYTRLLRTGEQMTLRGTPPFRLVVGNAATVRLSYDGRPIDLSPYIGDKVARLTLE
jgi:cytoskeleton protein RodZ